MTLFIGHYERRVSAARMKLPVDRPQAVAVDVGVLLRRADAGVAEQFLHRAQVGAAGEQVRGEAVPQRVRADLGVAGRPGGRTS